MRMIDLKKKVVCMYNVGRFMMNIIKIPTFFVCIFRYLKWYIILYIIVYCVAYITLKELKKKIKL